MAHGSVIWGFSGHQASALKVGWLGRAGSSHPKGGFSLTPPGRKLWAAGISTSNWGSKVFYLS